METFFWQSSIHELPAEGQSIIVQYKTFEFEQVKYTKAKQEWFERNVQCWLKPCKISDLQSAPVAQ